MVIVMMGVGGAGKTTLGQQLSAALGTGFIDADVYHCPRSVEKMSRGIPLDDTDRAPWLRRVNAEILRSPARTVLACSALKRAYRDVLRTGTGAGVWFVHLDIGEAEVRRRLAARKGHYFPEALAGSQFTALEPLQPDEHGVTLDASRPLDELLAETLATAPGTG
ncbi:gluconokinase [Streptomyces sp. NPDC088348]|uniref:gluconokinase n=1 Tax=Streptomyces sp. NPDC088348 TaxID=3365853 RepID=UPI0038041891